MIGCKKGSSGADSNQPAHVVSINNISLPENNTGESAFEFTLSLNKTSSQPVTVTYSTIEGLAKAGEDYKSVTNQSATFLPNELTKKIIITIIADDQREADEDFTLMLTGATNATIQQHKATGVIVNDDTKISFTNTGYDAPTTYTGYALSWADEFNGTALDATAWSNQNGDGCPTICGWGNNELEYYTGRPDNLFFQDGKLIIEVKKETYNGKDYTSSKIFTAGKKTF